MVRIDKCKTLKKSNRKRYISCVYLKTIHITYNFVTVPEKEHNGVEVSLIQKVPDIS